MDDIFYFAKIIGVITAGGAVAFHYGGVASTVQSTEERVERIEVKLDQGLSRIEDLLKKIRPEH